MIRSASRLVAATLVAVALAACSSTPTTSSTGEWFDDGWITTKVKTQLIGDEKVAARDIQVETFRGTVQLSGFARSQAEIDRAVRIARGTSGVKAVRNDIRLRSAQ